DPEILTPGRSVTRSGTDAPIPAAIDEAVTLDWLNGKSEFKNRPLSEIFAELERQFNLEIKHPADLDVSKTYSVGFANTGLEQALAKVFNPIAGYRMERNGNVITLVKE
ncbi:MAG: DUF4974 domain-containing protein, partial [Bacteroidota bacterium]